MQKRCLELILVLFVVFWGAAVAQAAAVVIKPDKQEQTRKRIQDQLGPKASFALVVGISEFDSASWPDLGGVEHEYGQVIASLRNQNFEIDPESRIGRVDKATLREIITGFIDKHGNAARNRLVIYVATHGYKNVQDPEAYGYLVTSDSVAPGATTFADRAFSVKDLSTALGRESMQAQHVFMFFNACFSGSMVPDPMRSQQLETGLPNAKPPVALSPEVADWTLDLLSLNARMVLTAGSDDQEVPDRNNPFSLAFVAGLGGAADADGDGLILGTELAQFMRGFVARETRKAGRANDPAFAVIPKIVPPSKKRDDAREGLDYALQGDFVFLSPKGARETASAGLDESEEILKARASRLPPRHFTECADCPVMVQMPVPPVGEIGEKEARIAIARTETTYAEWDACFRELGCNRYIADDGRGRGDRPVGGVTWQDVQEYLAWASSKARLQCSAYRLPTDGEWIGAAHADSNPFDQVSQNGKAVCWGCGTGHDGSEAAAVASLPANSLGLYDMFGNLWEWVDAEGVERCTIDDLNRQGGCERPGKVLGGSFATQAATLDRPIQLADVPRTSNARPWSLPTVGFRVACDLK
ncbi:MAG: SUMF1/EgtB/PvdO family nonheme iron enzyme [Rhizobiaceae bacterium]